MKSPKNLTAMQNTVLAGWFHFFGAVKMIHDMIFAGNLHAD